MEYLALQEVFEHLGLRKLVCQVFADNVPPLKLHAKFGFQQEGYRRAHRLHNGEFTDIVELALFAEDWPKVAEEMAPRVFRD